MSLELASTAVTVETRPRSPTQDRQREPETGTDAIGQPAPCPHESSGGFGKLHVADSVRRQGANARTVAEEHSWKLDEELHEAAVSAFRGLHRVKGALGSFSRRVKQGSVPWISAHPRVAGPPVHGGNREAVELYLALINAGIVIALFKADGKVELHERPVDFAQLILALVEFHRAHSESAHKSRCAPRLCGLPGSRKRGRATNPSQSAAPTGSSGTTTRGSSSHCQRQLPQWISRSRCERGAPNALRSS
jgi:hypothetical protein